MKVYEFQGKNVQKAIEEGLKELNKSQFDVDIKVLESGGLFKKAKVQIVVEDEEEVLDVAPVKEEVKEPVAQEPVNEVVETILEEQPVEEKVEEEQPKVKVHISDYEDGKDVHEESVKQEKQEKQRVYEDNKGSKEFISGLLKVLNIEGEVFIEEKPEHTKAIISCNKAGLLIGHRGETLSSLQYLTNIIEQKTNKYAKRVIVDVADYRERRDDSLKDLADRMARKVVRTKRRIKLNPMNAYERRIVHTYLQNFAGVTTHSEGEEPRRYLIIDVKRD